MTSGEDQASLHLLCDTAGVITGGDRADITPGVPLSKSFWFDHADCDQRELARLITDAAAGKFRKTRLWMRVDANSLLRVEVGTSPMRDASGKPLGLLFWTEPTGTRRRDLTPVESKPLVPTIRPVETDLLAVRMPVPMMRLDTAGQTIRGANDAMARLTGRSVRELVSTKLTDLTDPAGARTLIERAKAFEAEVGSEELIELTLRDAMGRSIDATASLIMDAPDRADSVLVVVRDRTAERSVGDLLRAADQIAELSRRNESRLRMLEKLIEHAPIGIMAGTDDRLQPLNRVAREANADGQSIEFEAEGIRASLTLPGSLVPARQDHAQIEQLRAEAMRHREALGALSEHLPAGLVSIDASGLITSANAAAGGMLATSAIDLVGRDVMTMLPGLMLDSTETGAQTLVLAGGGVIDAHLLAGDPRRIVLLDRTPQWHASRQAEAAAESLALAGEVAQVGLIDWDLHAGSFRADDRAREMLGGEGSQLNDARMLLAAAPDADRLRVERSVFDALEPERGGRMDVEFDAVATARRVRVVGRVAFMGEGAHRVPSRLALCVIDLTTRKLEASKLESLQQSLDLRVAEINALFEATNDAIRLATTGPTRHNAGAVRLYGPTIAAIAPTNHAEWIERLSPTDPRGKPVDAEHLPTALAATGQAATSELRLGAAARVVQSTATPVTLNGQTVGVVCVDADLTEARESERAAARWRALLGASGSLAAVVDESGAIVQASASFDAMRGDAASLDAMFVDFVCKSLTAGVRMRVRIRRREADPLDAVASIQAIDAKPTSFLVHLVDSSDTSRLREQLVESQGMASQIAALAEQAGRVARLGLAILDKKGVRPLNSAAAELVGTGTTLQALNAFSWLDRDGKPIAARQLPWNQAGGAIVPQRLVRVGDDGSKRHFDCTVDRQEGVTLIALRDDSATVELQRQLVEARSAAATLRTGQGELLARAQAERTELAARARVASRLLRVPVRLMRDAAGDRASGSEIDELSASAMALCEWADGATHTRPARDVSGRFDRTVDLNHVVTQAARLVEAHQASPPVDLSLAQGGAWARASVSATRIALFALLGGASDTRGRCAVLTRVDAGRGVVTLKLDRPPDPMALSAARCLLELFGAGVQLDVSQPAMPGISFEVDHATLRPVPSQPTATLRVMLLEDHGSTARVLGKQLARCGCEVEHVSTLADARRITGGNREFDLLICDLTIEDGDVCQWVSRETREHATPAIALATFGSPVSDAEIDKAGFVARLTKPVDLHQLSAIIDRVRVHAASMATSK
jgi:PAS domain-containing protein/CheY-like chemotaxis protein